MTQEIQNTIAQSIADEAWKDGEMNTKWEVETPLFYSELEYWMHVKGMPQVKINTLWCGEVSATPVEIEEIQALANDLIGNPWF